MTGAVAADSWEQLLLSRPLGDYTLQSCIGRGGFGYVFEAIHTTSGARFAVKVLKPTSSEASNLVDFENEGVLLRRLKTCDGVIDYIESGSETFTLDAAPGIVVPIPIRFHVLAVASGSAHELASDPATRNSLGWTARLRLWRDAVVAIQQMHLRDIAHRDLKAENCLLMVRGNITRVKLADLGRAKDMSIAPAHTPWDYLHGRGDMRFAPPEFLFLQGEATVEDFVAADYYGLGSLLVEITSGQPLSALALGDWGAVVRLAEEDLRSGQRRDLAGLTGLFRAVTADVVSEMPATIRVDASTLLDRLCHPIPQQRLLSSPYGRDRLAKNPLDWVIRRADIMIKRLEIEAREQRRNRKISA